MPTTHRARTELRREHRGPVLTPDDAGYEAARTLYNTMIDLRPAVIAQCDGPDDVATALRIARRHDLEVAVRGGGHGVAGTSSCDGGLVVDLRRMRQVEVDPHRRTARVGGGATMRDLDLATTAHGLATTGGRTSTTGVGGLALGGGTGWLDRRFGLLSDHLLAAEVVTADGQHLTASETDHPELFWALHGGGGNFGVVTSFELRLHPIGTVRATILVWEAGRGAEVLAAYRDELAAAPDELGGAAKFHTAPDAPWVSAEHRRTRACTVAVVDTASSAAGEATTTRLRRLGPVAELPLTLGYADLQSQLDDPPGFRNRWSAQYLDTLPDEAIARFCHRAEDLLVPSPSEQLLVPLGGAVARGRAEHPIPWRAAPWHVFAFGLWLDPADDARALRWAHGLRDDLAPWSTGAVYLNFIGDEGPARTAAGYGARHLARLAAVKARYDPDNVFHRNHNILPAADTLTAS
jgi:FAD/FMN-containing dehydrogenase